MSIRGLAIAEQERCQLAVLPLVHPERAPTPAEMLFLPWELGLADSHLCCHPNQNLPHRADYRTIFTPNGTGAWALGAVESRKINM